MVSHLFRTDPCCCFCHNSPSHPYPPEGRVDLVKQMLFSSWVKDTNCDFVPLPKTKAGSDFGACFAKNQFENIGFTNNRPI